ncbi:MAG: hypothetical protein LBR64_09095 [Dysgonamonadaceae bacterium]|jgi:hypothetical protein|nr:hypothetical protein [Dysgonamonadaceae bacterium]
MKTEGFLDNFVATLKYSAPQKGQLAEILTDVLGIEKEAVYRRLRGAVPFSATEIFKIASEFKISLDGIAGGLFPSNKPLFVRITDFINPSESDFKFLEAYSEDLYKFFKDPNSESGAIGNVIPSSLAVAYPNIYKFYFFKWVQQFKAPKNKMVYDEMFINERIEENNRDFLNAIRTAPKTVYVFDRNLIKNFVSDVRFFFDVRLLSSANVADIKTDLNRFIDDMERYADEGRNVVGNAVEIYLSNIHFDASYNYISSQMLKVVTMRSFAFSDAFSMDADVYKNMENWVSFLKNSSTLISGSNYNERVKYFEQQRNIIELL